MFGQLQHRAGQAWRVKGWAPDGASSEACSCPCSLTCPSSNIAVWCSLHDRRAGMGAGLGKQGGQWAEFLWGLIIGLQLSLASYVFGQQCALCVDYYLVPGGAVEADLEFRSQE